MILFEFGCGYILNFFQTSDFHFTAKLITCAGKG